MEGLSEQRERRLALMPPAWILRRTVSPTVVVDVGPGGEFFSRPNLGAPPRQFPLFTAPKPNPRPAHFFQCMRSATTWLTCFLTRVRLILRVTLTRLPSSFRRYSTMVVTPFASVVSVRGGNSASVCMCLR